MPTLVVLGGKDVEDILRIGELLHSGIAGARKVLIGDAAHHPNVERPAKFDRTVFEFLETLD